MPQCHEHSISHSFRCVALVLTMLVQPDDPTFSIGASIEAKVMSDMSLLRTIARMPFDSSVGISCDSVKECSRPNLRYLIVDFHTLVSNGTYQRRLNTYSGYQGRHQKLISMTR